MINKNLRFEVFFLTTMLLLTVTACKKEKKCIDGNGDFVQETRYLEAYNSVQVYNDADIYYSTGTEARADVFAESNIVPLIATNITAQVLSIAVTNDDCYHATATPEVTLMAPNCYEFSLFGSGKLVANGINRDYYKIESLGSGPVNSSFNVQAFVIDSQGSGDANLAGSAVQSIISVTGSGNVYAGNAVSDSCIVISEGSGNITITVTSFLDVSISGSGNVYYSGDPVIIEHNTGSGELIKQGK